MALAVVFIALAAMKSIANLTPAKIKNVLEYGATILVSKAKGC